MFCFVNVDDVYAFKLFTHKPLIVLIDIVLTRRTIKTYQSPGGAESLLQRHLYMHNAHDAHDVRENAAKDQRMTR